MQSNKAKLDSPFIGSQIAELPKDVKVESFIKRFCLCERCQSIEL